MDKHIYGASYILYTLGSRKPDIIHTDKDEIDEQYLLSVSQDNVNRLVVYGKDFYLNGQKRTWRDMQVYFK